MYHKHLNLQYNAQSHAAQFNFKKLTANFNVIIYEHALNGPAPNKRFFLVKCRQYTGVDFVGKLHSKLQ